MVRARLILGVIVPSLFLSALSAGCNGAAGDGAQDEDAQTAQGVTRNNGPETFIVYLHGRSSQQWHGDYLANAQGWKNVTVRYDGDAALADGGVARTVENAVLEYCSGDRACVLACHSAGCMRALLVLDELQSKGKGHNVLWVAAAASAAGGTRLAEIWVPFDWGRVPVDHDMRRDRARSSAGWRHIQDATRLTPMYHVAGRKDECFGRFLCGNFLLPGGTCDGVVCMDSASGASQTSRLRNGCDAAKYPGRVYDNDSAPCDGLNLSHTWVGLDLGKLTARSLEKGR